MNKERAAAYLGNGLKQAEVASIMGVSPGYIAQLMKEEGFQLMVAEKAAELDGSEEREESSIHMKYIGLEHKLIASIGNAVEGAELRDQIRALQVVAERQEKVAIRKMPMREVGGGSGGNTVYVQLMLPSHAIPAQPKIALNGKNEVVEIDGKPLAPMSSSAVEKMFRREKALSVAKEEVEKIKAIEKEI